MTLQDKKLSQKSFFTIIVVTIFMAAITLYSIYTTHKDKEKSFYNEKINALHVAYTSNIHKYKLLTQWIFDEFINTEETLNLFKKGVESKNNKRYYRGLLYQKLSKRYALLSKYNIRQLHFHTPTNESFLRFHKPSKNGDNLTDMRPSIASTNFTQSTSSTFETGRVVSGFRNVFPLHYETRHIGSVEISATTEAILKALENLDKSKNYRFILNKNIVYPKLFENQKRLYSPSYIHPDFIREDANKLLVKHDDYSYFFKKDIKNINKILSEDKNLKIALETGQAYGTTIKYEGAYHTIVFLPMLGMHNALEGYLISYGEEKNIPFVLANEWILYLIVVFGAFFFIFLMFLIKKRTDTIETQKEWFQSIINTLDEGLYVMDSKGIITFINDSACKHLGYDKNELLGKQAHASFHKHKKESNLEQCPIYTTTLKKEIFHSNKEYFKRKDKSIFPIDISSVPLLKGNKVSQIISTFKDITTIKIAQEKMQMLTTALEASMNAIVITDVNANIEWTNPAFEKMTGFTKEEAIGKKPKDLVSSGKQSKDFYTHLWENILAKKAWKGELINKSKNGSHYHEELSITPVLNEKDEITHFIAIKQDISLRKKHEKNMEILAFYDVLTGLPNRRLFMDRFDTLLSQMKRNSFCSALLFLDLDKFKSINDSLGHEAGDIVLQETAKRLSSITRNHDTIARLGGDEFVLLISHLDSNPNKAYNDIQKITYKICENIRIPFEILEKPHNISVSVGAYIFSDAKIPAKSLFQKADQALYEAKSKGRDTYHITTQNNKNKAN